tara:strand:- start:151 stop:321 length:171 start_codon:yes stop_codon:yes gene_type:complete
MINFINFQILPVYSLIMKVKNVSLIVIVAIAGFTLLLVNESQLNENWLVHCLSCIG